MRLASFPSALVILSIVSVLLLSPRPAASKSLEELEKTLACVVHKETGARYQLATRNLPRPPRKTHRQLREDDAKTPYFEIMGNVVVFLTGDNDETSAGSDVDPTMEWMTFVLHGVSLYPEHLVADFVWDSERREYYLVLVYSVLWDVTIRVYRLPFREPLGVSSAVFDGPRERWPSPAHPDTELEVRLPGRHPCGASEVRGVIIDDYLRLFLMKDRPDRCPTTELGLDLETLEWRLMGDTVEEAAGQWTMQRENIGKRLQLCFVNHDEKLETRLTCARRLGEMQYLPAIRTLVKHVEVEEPAGGEGLQRYPAAWALSQFGMAAVPEIVRKLLRFEQPEPRIREILLQILRQDEIKGEARAHVAGIGRLTTIEKKRNLAEALLEEL